MRGEVGGGKRGGVRKCERGGEEVCRGVRGGV